VLAQAALVLENLAANVAFEAIHMGFHMVSQNV